MTTGPDPRFPSAIRPFWVEFDKEVTWLHGRWIIYRQLYGTSPARVDLLNASAGTFFNVLQDVLLHDVQLSISKLGDPAGSGTRTNMTLHTLRQLLKAAGEHVAVDKMHDPLERFEAACTQIRHRRNKWIAHFDQTTMLDQQVNPRMGPSRTEIEVALEALRDTINAVSVHYTDTTIGYDHFYMQADGEALLDSLRRGIRYRELVNEGAIPSDDLRSRFRGEA